MIVKPEPSTHDSGCPRFPEKLLFRTHAQAAIVAKRQRAWSPGERIRVYRCRGHFHTGHVRRSR